MTDPRTDWDQGHKCHDCGARIPWGGDQCSDCLHMRPVAGEDDRDRPDDDPWAAAWMARG